MRPSTIVGATAVPGSVARLACKSPTTSRRFLTHSEAHAVRECAQAPRTHRLPVGTDRRRRTIVGAAAVPESAEGLARESPTKSSRFLTHSETHAVDAVRAVTLHRLLLGTDMRRRTIVGATAVPGSVAGLARESPAKSSRFLRIPRPTRWTQPAPLPSIACRWGTDMRRRTIVGAAVTAVVAGSIAGLARKSQAAPWRFFTPSEARTVDAVCERLIPADRDPGRPFGRRRQLHRHPTLESISQASPDLSQRTRRPRLRELR